MPMSPEEKQLLERAVALGEENNKILRGIRNSNRWGLVYKVLYWAVIIALSYGAYVQIQPYVNSLMKEYASLKGTVNTVQKTASQLPDLGKLLNNLPK